MDRKEYRLSGLVSIIFRISSVIALIVGLIFFVAILVGGKETKVPKIVSVVWLMAGIFYSAFFCMLAEVINVLIKIERNTRQNPATLSSSKGEEQK